MTARDLLFFLLGAGFGSGLAYLVMSREEEEEVIEPVQTPVKDMQDVQDVQNDEEMSEVEAVVKERMDPPKKSTIITKETSTLDGYKSARHVPTKDYFKIAGDYTAYGEDDTGLNQVEKDFLANMSRDPEIIPPEVWKAGEEGPYSHVTLIYYPESGLLKYEANDAEVDIPYLLIGNAIEDSLFQFSEANFMYVRNFRNQIDYEILKFNPKMVK